MLEGFQSDVCHGQKVEFGQLELSGGTVYFPWSSKQVFFPGKSDPDSLRESLSSFSGDNEAIMLNKSHSRADVRDLSAFNSLRQRDVVYDDQSAMLDSSPESSDLDIQILGVEDSDEKMLSYDLWGGDGQEGDDQGSRQESQSRYGFSGAGSGRFEGNILNIDVSGISVSAINSVEGGSAVATSNIIIRPVQIFFNSREVEERLR